MRTLVLAALLAGPALAQTWAVTLPTPGDDLAIRAVEAPGGDLYVAGWSEELGALVRRLAPDGSVLWTRAFEGVWDSSGAYDVVVAANGDALVCGFIDGNSWVARLSPVGALVWESSVPWIYDGAEGVDNGDPRLSGLRQGESDHGRGIERIGIVLVQDKIDPAAPR